jgi:hypothetical protein
VKRCSHGNLARYCPIRSCPHWDGVQKTHELNGATGPKRVYSKGERTRDMKKRVAR